MGPTSLKLFAFTVTSLAASFSAVAIAAASPTGTWSSVGCETVDGANHTKNHTRREIAFTGTHWAMDVDFFADPECQQKALTFHAEGPYKVFGKSKTVKGANEAEFTFEKVVATPYAKFFVDILGSAGAGKCGAQPWALGIGQDISAGCPPLGLDLTSCPKEFDLLKVNGKTLQLGQRPSDGGYLCTADRRPSALSGEMKKADK